jgi:alkylated DNA nucleotide flippase Atl1
VGDPTPYAERVLAVVARVPRGRVTTYGDVAELLGEGGPRAVGTVMSRWGGGVPWWRVVRADGTPPLHKAGEAQQRLRAEGVAFAADRVDLRAARWDGTSCY